MAVSVRVSEAHAPPVAVVEASRSVQPEAKTASSKAVAREFQNLPERQGITAQEKDVQLVTLATVLKKGHVLTSEDFKNGEPVTSLKLAEVYKKDKARGEVESLTHMLNPNFQDTGLTGEPMMVNVDGKQQQVTRIKSRDGVLFTCEVGGKEVKLPVSEIISAQIVSMFKSPEVRALFTADELIVIEAHLDSLAGKPDKANQLDKAKLQELALSSGLITAESLRTFAEKNGMVLTLKNEDVNLLTEGIDEEKATVISNNKTDNVEIQKNIDLFEGRTVAAPETVTQVIKTMLPDGISKSMISLEVESVKLTAEREGLQTNDPQLVEKGKAIDAKQAEINKQINMLKEAQKFVDGDGEVAMMEIFGAVQRGDIPATKIAALDAALKENDPLKVIYALSDTGNLNDAQKKEVSKYEGLYKTGKVSIWVALGSIGMMVWQALKIKEGVG